MLYQKLYIFLYSLQIITHTLSRYSMLEKCKIKSLFISTLDDDTESPKCKPEMTSQTSESQSSGESQEMQEEHETPTLQVKKRFRFTKMRQNHSTLRNDMFNN